MALIFSPIKAKDLKVISQQDSALDKGDDPKAFAAAYESYLKGLDESKLTFIEGETPTYFHVRTAATQEEITKQKDSMAGLAIKAKETGEMPIYSMMLATVKVSLRDITTGEESSFIKGTHGLASDDIMTWLVANDIVADLFNALESNRGATDQEILKKKLEHSSSSTLQITQS